MTITNHIQTTDEVYCRIKAKKVFFDESHYRNYCLKCPLIRGTAQGEGIECYFDNGVEGIDTVVYLNKPEHVDELTNAMNGAQPMKLTKKSIDVIKLVRDKAKGPINERAGRPREGWGRGVPAAGILSKYRVYNPEKVTEDGTVTFGTEFPVEWTSQDEKLNEIAAMLIMQAVIAPTPDGGMLFAKVGDVQYPEAFLAKMTELGYEYEKIDKVE